MENQNKRDKAAVLYWWHSKIRQIQKVKKEKNILGRSIDCWIS